MIRRPIFNSPNFEIVFDMLDDGVEAGKIEYEKYNVDTSKKTPEADGYIYMVTTPPKVNSKPYIHITANEDEDLMVSKVQELGARMNDKELDKDLTTLDEVFMVEEIAEQKTKALTGVVINIEGKNVALNKEDMIALNSMMELCKEYNYKIKEVICE